MSAETRLGMRVVLLGLLSWLIPFAAGILLFAVKKANSALFTTLMYLVVLVTAGALFGWYFRNRAVSVREGLLVGAAWLAISLVLDYPMFAFGPLKMSPLAYYSEIGLVYLTFPLFGLLAPRMAKA